MKSILSRNGWPEILKLFEGAKSDDASDAEYFAGRLVSILGPRIDPVSFKELSRVDLEPLPDGMRAKVAQGALPTWLVFEFDEASMLASLTIQHRMMWDE